ncbi:MAG TPA: FAD-dependent oxidoreductase [Alphaproteobacteria bacterium]|nr:FAD-dependent oxidoreductase [Alphaproteobacteria bacterium]
MAASVVIVGSGPGGFYAADALQRRLEGCRVDIIDRLPTPFGLVRGGVAPDHQSTKAVQRVFERTATRPGVRFLGGIEVGSTVSYDELKAAYDAVVVAIGCPRDKKLGIPGEELKGVYGSWSFVGWLNGHPGFRNLAPDLSARAIAVIGNGNVAIDCVRVLAKTPAEMAKSDLCRHAAEVIAAAPLERLYLIGRHGPVEARFTPLELGELGELERCTPLLDGTALERDIAAAGFEEVKAKEKMLAILRRFAANRPGAKPLELHFLFWSAPLAILGQERVGGLELERTRLASDGFGSSGETSELAVQSVITAIGYAGVPFAGLPFDERRGIVRNEGGRVEPGVYAAGWAKRGPSGTIPVNRADAIAVAELIAADLEARGAQKPGPAALDALLAARGVRPVSFAEWQRINQAEVARAGPGRPREKFTRIEEMLAAARA